MHTVVQPVAPFLGDAAGAGGAPAARVAIAGATGYTGQELLRPLAREADVVFLALPDAAAAELAPALVDAGVRVIDLSGAFRLRDDGARAHWYPHTHRLPEGV